MKLNPNCKKPHPCEECHDRCISEVAFLCGMSEERQLEIMNRSVRRSLRRGDYLFREGDRVNSIVVIQQGQVKLTTCDVEGRENIIGIFSDRETIWEGAFSEDNRYPFSAVCLTPTNCCFVRLSDVESAISTPTVALKVINMLSQKLRDANERNMILSINEPVKRVAAFLIYSVQRSDEPFVKLRLEDIAGSVGLRPETVSRNIRRLVSDGLVEKTGQSGFRVPDFERLRDFVSE